MGQVMGQSRTYHLTDPAALAAKIQSAGGPKLDPTQPTGEASDCGVKLGKPFLIPASTVWEHVDALFAVSNG